MEEGRYGHGYEEDKFLYVRVMKTEYKRLLGKRQ